MLRCHSTNEVQGPFNNAVNLLQKADIGGKPMIEVIDNLANLNLH